jgi:hypothetical protein
MLVTKAQHDGQIELEPRKVLSPFNKGDDFGFVPPAQTPSKNCQIESLLIVPLTNGNDVGAISVA